MVRTALASVTVLESTAGMFLRIRSVLPKLQAFYNDHILVELAYPRVKFGLLRLDLRGC